MKCKETDIYIYIKVEIVYITLLFQCFEIVLIGTRSVHYFRYLRFYSMGCYLEHMCMFIPNAQSMCVLVVDGKLKVPTT